MPHLKHLLALSLCTFSAHAATPVASGVEVIPGTFVAGTQPDGNTVVFAAPDGLVVFDTGRHREHTQKIVDFANGAKKPVVAIVNSHWHLDHVGGNVMLRNAYPDVRVYASGAIDDALHGFLASYRAQLEDAIAKAGGDATKTAPWKAEIALIDAGPSLAPDERIAESGTRSIARRAFEIGFESRAVTAGDVWLRDPATHVLASGDLVTPRVGRTRDAAGAVVRYRVSGTVARRARASRANRFRDTRARTRSRHVPPGFRDVSKCIRSAARLRSQQHREGVVHRRMDARRGFADSGGRREARALAARLLHGCELARRYREAGAVVRSLTVFGAHGSGVSNASAKITSWISKAPTSGSTP
jgi:glyoxylase-like metal-dependent hydrolase (beta-lactamase superfamily II)